MTPEEIDADRRSGTPPADGEPSGSEASAENGDGVPGPTGRAKAGVTAGTGRAQDPPPDEHPLEVDLPEPPARSGRVVVPRWIQLVVLPLGLLALWALARAAGAVFLVFIIAAVIALILNPLVKLLERGRLPRGLAVFAVYIGFFAGLGGIGVLIATPASDQLDAFQRSVPALVRSANQSLTDVQSYLDRHGIRVQIRRQGQSALQVLEKNVVRRSGTVVAFGRDLLQTLVGAAFGLVLVLVISIYMLLYGESIGRIVRSVMPPGDGTPEDDFPLRVQKAVFGYVRGQVAFSLIMGTTAALGLWIFGLLGIFPEGRTYAVFFGVFFGLMEFVPYVGPIIGPLPAILVAFFDSPLTGLWVALLFLALQQIEGHVVAPQIFGHSLRINPLVVIFSLLFGAEVYGIIGAIVALPIAAVGRETVVYLRRHLVLEPWSPTLAAAGGAGGDPLALTGMADPGRGLPRCPQCEATGAPDDVFCRSCGSPLAPRVEARG